MTYAEPSFDDDAGPRADGIFVDTATKLYARTGVWPWWFVRTVGEDVPRGYVVLALRHRRELERELGVTLPVRRAPPRAPKRRIEQLGLEGVETPKTRVRRGAA